MMPSFAFGWALLLGAVAAPAVNPLPTAHTFTPAMTRQIDDIAKRAVHEGGTLGLAIGVVEDGRIVYADGAGFANDARHIRFDASTQSFIGDATEQFTAAAVLLLEQDGKLKTDDKVTKYIPELSIASNVTISDLLWHASGLPDYRQAPGIATDRTRTIKLTDLIGAVNKLKMAEEPGTIYRDNKLDYMIAGLIVERASGIPLSDYLQQHVFLPLVMNQTFLAGDTGISPFHAVGYTGRAGHFFPARVDDSSWLYGYGSMVTDVYDLAKWDIGLPLLLRVDAVREMFSPSPVAGPPAVGYGWTIDQRSGRRYVWSNGEIAGYRAMNALLPDEHIAVIVLTNTDSQHSIRLASPEAIASHVLDIIVPPVQAHFDNAIVELARVWLDRIAQKRIDRTQLTAQFSNYLTDRLVAESDFAALGKPQAIIPLASNAGSAGDTVYEFLVRFPHDQYHYRLALAKDGKIDGLFLAP